MNTILFVLRSGGEYKPEHVERLRQNIASHVSNSIRFACMSDVSVPCERIPLRYQWSGWYSKMELCRPDIEGDILYFDLDTIIVDSLDDILSVNKTTVLRDFYWHRVDDKNYNSINSAMMYLTAEDRARVWQHWIADPQARQNEAGKDGDQFIYEAVLGKTADRWQDILPGQIISYKADVVHAKRKIYPPNTRVVCFHGKPRPWQAKDRWVRNVLCPPQQNQSRWSKVLSWLR